MSYDYRYSRTTTNTRPGRRSLYAPPPTRGNAAHHGFFTYWMPLLVTGTIAVGGLVAWVWSERNEHDEDDYPHEKPPRPQTGPGGTYPAQGSQPYPGPPPPQGQGPMPQYQGPPPGQAGPPPPPPPGGEAASYYNQTTQSYSASQSQSRDAQQQEMDPTWYGRMSGMMKRTPSPEQFFDTARKSVSAGMGAMGAALGSIMEDSDEHYDEKDAGRRARSSEKRSDRRDRREEREGFSDHERWSDELDERQQINVVEADSERRADDARNIRDETGQRRSKKAVAIVVSADTNADLDRDDDMGYRMEHASILSHLPTNYNSTSTDIFVLIYAPGLKSLPPLNYRPAAGPGLTSTAGSTYSQISTPAATPGSELQSMSPRVDAMDSPSRQFDAVYQQALSLVSSSTQILPFTTPDGYVHILRHLAPGLVYISDTLSGEEGEDIAQLKGWVGHTILVAGDEGHGGLADTETETEDERQRNGDGRKKERRRKWYDTSSMVGLGKDVEVVDAVRVGDDWERRLGGRQR